MDIKAIVESNDTLPGRTFDLIVQALILFSVITFSIETLPDLDAGTRKLLEVTEVIIAIIFTCEYFLRLYVAERKMSYALSFYGLIDLIAIVPFYLLPGVDLRSLRLFRLLSLFRLMKLLRYNKAIHQLSRALTIAREEIILFSLITLMLLYLSAVGIYYFENEAQPETFKSIFHSLWWAVATLSTVGYGDMYPITIGGKLFTFIILMLGLCIVAIPTGLLASALSRVKLEDHEKESTALDDKP
ncbi:ion transporter [Candidatus Thiosymbion oneisti]|uniref:ion transporter n=1 Tax=Candidatus Thiosymbion oneisti TaxID=589554 RepID=UPI000AD348E4|nr:ion transporter [Candidatus Thiosymbion oneisti]